ncbi:hypothetical protein [Oceanobacillus rekensis]|uniref:hypothetical protein n=1 Tax=Oceanobacillus rekensis TaxID=937927 RepID=UPI001FEABF1E|nr:hypothetical protein [Oceanobacillus rekensis]
MIGKSEKDAKQANIDLIVNAAKLADVNGDFGTVSESGGKITIMESKTMTVDDLMKAGYLDEIPVIPGDDTEDYSSGEVTKDTDGTISYTSDVGKPTTD